MRFNLDTNERLNTWKKQMDYAKKNYRADALAQEKQKIINEMQNYLSTLDAGVSKASSEIEKELSELERPVAIQQRNLSTDEITQLNYATKVILSRLQGAVAGGSTDIVGVLKDIVEQGDTQTRWAFVDSIHEVYATAEKLIDIPAEDKTTVLNDIAGMLKTIVEQGDTKVDRAPIVSNVDTKDKFNAWARLKSQIDEQYKAAMDSLKTSQKLAADQAYTEKKSELETERFNLSLHSASAKANVENALQELKGDFFSSESEKQVNYF